MRTSASIFAVVLLAVFIVGCPPIENPPPVLDLRANLDGRFVQAFAANDDAGVVSFELMRKNEDGDWFPVWNANGVQQVAHTQSWGVHESVTVEEVSREYLGSPVFFYSGWYYWSSGGEYHPIPFAADLFRLLNASRTGTVETRTIDIVHSTGAYLAAQFELDREGWYAVRASGLTTDNQPFASAQFEEVGYFKGIDGPDDPGDPNKPMATFHDLFVSPWKTVNGYLDGYVSISNGGVPTDYFLACDIAVEGVWHQKPGWGEEGRVSIAHDGYFFVDFTKAGNDHEATSFWLRVVPRSVTDIPNCGLDPSLCLVRPEIPEAIGSILVLRPPISNDDDGSGEVTIGFRDIPAYLSTDGTLTGMVTADNLADLAVLVYIHVDGVAWQKPDCGVLIPIAADGSWSTNVYQVAGDELATHISAFAVPLGTVAPCVIYPQAKAVQAAAVCVDGICIDGAKAGVIVNRVPNFNLVRIPSYGDLDGTTIGMVSAPDPTQWQIGVYAGGIPGESGWVIKPGFAPGDAIVPSLSGSWVTDLVTGGDDHLASQYWFMLFPVGTAMPQCGQIGCPNLTDALALSVADIWINRQPGADTIAPAVTLLGVNPMVLEVGATFVDPGATATDNIDGDLTSSIVVTGTVNTNAVGSYSLTYSATDSSGNTGSAVRTVNVVDTTAPVVTVLGSNPMSVALNSQFVDPGATATDNIDGDLTSSIVVTGTVDTGVAGSYSLTYSATDSSGNTGSAVRTVIVSGDIEPPVITILGTNPLTLEVLSGGYSDAGATASDNVDGDISGLIQTVSTVNMTLVGNYIVTYTVTDSSGNTATAVRNVSVVDTTDPVIGTPIADIVLYQHQSYQVDLANHGYDAYDASASWAATGYDPELIEVGITAGTLLVVDANLKLGTTTMTLTITDSSGNQASQDVVVTVSSCGDNLINIDVLPGDIDSYTIAGTICGSLDPAAHRIVVYVMKQIGDYDFVFVKPGYDALAYTPIASNGYWSTSVNPDSDWKQIKVVLVEEGTNVPMCGANPPTCFEEFPDFESNPAAWPGVLSTHTVINPTP
ncbi:MAG: DUF5011 domain-containing protein [Patescibacteria group bacterium]|jgi:hypothetical protein|nr:DUF5011 domain-containing protein [Patescibacteria group bacterium]